MSGWQDLNIGSICIKIIDYRGKTPEKVLSGTKLITSKVIKNSRILDNANFEYIRDDKYEEVMRRGKPEFQDILFTTEAPLGEVALIKSDEKIAIAQRIILLRADQDKVIPDFLFYSLRGPIGYNRVQQKGTGTTVLGIKNPELKKVILPIPPLPTQQKIAKILSNYDDLIENNLKRIKLLEESARLTYEEWFLRFRIDGKKLEIDPESGLPFGWRRVKVNSLVSYYIGGGWGEESISDDFSDKAYVIRGTDIDGIAYGKLEGAPLRYHKTSNLASRKLQNKDIVFEVSGGSKTEGVAKSLLITNNLLKQFNTNVMCASFCKLVRPKEQYLGNMLHLSYKYLRRSKATEVFEIKSASSIINYNWEAFIKHQDLIMPSHDTLIDFDKKVDVLVNGIYNLGHQNQLLKEARDILLPRLMTGMIDTDDMDIAV
jgi:type I restriction enzyme S subunit